MNRSTLKLTPEQYQDVLEFVRSYTKEDLVPALHLIDRLDSLSGMRSTAGSSLNQRVGQYTYNYVLETGWCLPKKPNPFPSLFYSSDVTVVNALLEHVCLELKMHIEATHNRLLADMQADLWQHDNADYRIDVSDVADGDDETKTKEQP